ERAELLRGARARQLLHAAIGGERDPLLWNDAEDLTHALGHLLRRFDLERAHVDHANGHAFVVRQISQAVDVGHLAAREIEYELVHARVEVVWENSRVSARGHADHFVAPRVAQAKMPRSPDAAHPLERAGDDLLHPSEILFAAQRGDPGAKIF